MQFPDIFDPYQQVPVMWPKASVRERPDIKKPSILYAGKMPYNKHKVKRGGMYQASEFRMYFWLSDENSGGSSYRFSTSGVLEEE